MRRKIELLSILCAVFVLCLCLFSCDKAPETNTTESTEMPATEKGYTTAKVDFIRVGKADSIVINTGSKIIMIDTGEEENLPRIHAYMQRNGYKKIDMLIITHYDKDHIGGAYEVINTYIVDTVVESTFVGNNEWYTSYHSLLEEKEIAPKKLNRNYSFTFDSCDFTVYAPKKEKYSSKQDNNSSLVISMKIGENSLLFCGDALEIRVAELVSDKIGHYDFIKIPHHGTYLANYSVFLDEITPAYAVITCSNKNPADERTMNVLAEYNTTVYQTKDGEINLIANGKDITITQQN